MSRDPSSAPLPAAKFEVPTSETKELEIYFRDLSPETQKAVLALYGLESPKIVLERRWCRAGRTSANDHHGELRHLL